MDKNLVDTSGWLEYFTNGKNADFFAPAVEDIDNLIVSVINVYEIFKKVLAERGENEALETIAILSQGEIVDVDMNIAIQASQISLQYKIPMADSILLATAQKYKAILWTQDKHFENIESAIKFISKE
jgi:predicted nucleic acid-binding protein